MSSPAIIKAALERNVKVTLHPGLACEVDEGPWRVDVAMGIARVVVFAILASASVSGCRCSSSVSPTGPVVSLGGVLLPGQARAYDVDVPSGTTSLSLDLSSSAVGLELIQVDPGCEVEVLDSCARLLRVGPPEAPTVYASTGRVTGARVRFIVRNTLATLAITFNLTVEPKKGSGCG